ncbi:MAG: histidine phosphatase family protein [Conchiformibius sp.]|nr:histidine phosphatase family protein [Conchiformibius sp.]
MDIILLRHAHAEAGSDDLARRLTAKGRKQAAAAAGFLQTRLPAHARVWASQAVRSRQTAACLHPYYRILPALNPDIDPRSLPPLLAALPDHSCTVLVGHQPWLGQLCAFLLTQSWDGYTNWAVEKGAFWWFHLHWQDGLPFAELKLVGRGFQAA